VAAPAATVNAFASQLPRLRLGLDLRRQRFGYRHRLARREVLAHEIFVALAARNLIEIDNGDRHLGPAERLACLEPPLARDQLPVRRYHDRMQQTVLGDAGAESS
jgi:hypothetical protein